MNSLRAKLTLALLAMSFVAIVVVGATARTVMLSRFDDFVVDRAIGGFLSEVSDYHRTYGSWESARTSEPFFEFVARTRPRMVRPAREGPPVGVAPGAPGERRPPPPRRDFEMGEEFVVAFPETDLDSAAVLAERLRKGLEEADWSPIDLRLVVTVSIGLHDASASGSMEEALDCADEKLDRAKDLGRNRVER